MEKIANAAMLTEKWAPVLNHASAGAIKDSYRKNVTAVLLENTERDLRETAVNSLSGTYASGSDPNMGNIASFSPVMISLVRRALPNIIAYDIASVQPMSGPTGLVFAMRSKYVADGTLSSTEALYDEPDTDFSGARPVTGTGVTANSVGAGGVTGDTEVGNDNIPNGEGGRRHAGGYGIYGATNETDPLSGNYAVGGGMTSAQLEKRGETNTPFSEMAFTIDKGTVTAQARALKAEYTTELAQDLKAVHGLDAESELSNILSTEILGEINREVIRTAYLTAERGSDVNNAASNTGNGRWMVERFKYLVYNIEKEANIIAKRTRRGKGNFLICSTNVASALSLAGLLDYSGPFNNNGIAQPDETGELFVGTLNGRIKVYVDPFVTSDYCMVGYKGTNPYDAGIFYCPYVPLQMVRATDPDTFQPKIAFKTRYGMATNPYNVTPSSGTIDINIGGTTALTRNNRYFRIFAVSNIAG
jgi:hypothetical protein